MKINPVLLVLVLLWDAIRTKWLAKLFAWVLFLIVPLTVIGYFLLHGVDQAREAGIENRRVYDACVIKAYETKQPWEIVNGKCYLKADL